MIDTSNGWNKLDEFTRAYLECALFAENNEEGDYFYEKYSIEDYSIEAVQQAINVCKLFQEGNKELLEEAYKSYPINSKYSPQSQAGHDFWFTCNGHGVGFWDRGLGDVGQKLSDLCGKNLFKSRSLYVGDDNKLYFQ